MFTPPELSRHDAATRKAEREQVLRAIMKYLTEKVEPKEAMYRLLGIEQYLESLREGAGK